ncbi:MAG: RagB/SusD family nutrient uptake outer membrane protein [Gemmatimonadales bacterium]|nr:RagB/SusD family nutrient uptake outer membrane protein [Gemmatimonadales bacterium]
MRRSSFPRAEHRLAHLVRSAVLGTVLCLTLAACDDLTSLDQEAPSRIPADSLERPENAPLLVQSAIGDFECALASYVVAAGLVGDELANSNLAQVLFDYDRRAILPTNDIYSTLTCDSGTPTVYTVLSTARFSADNALRLLDVATEEQVPDRTALIATAAAYAGYSLVLLGEGMCSAALDVGPELTPAQLLTEAENRFTRAIDAATTAGDEQTLNLALLGRARARLGLGNRPGAAEDAALIPQGFLVEATYSGTRTRRENRVFTFVSLFLSGTVDVPFRDLTFEGVPDPRVTVIDAGTLGADRVTPAFLPAKYSGFDSPIPVARWEEAQLILAEAAVAAGDVAGAVGIINTLHANAGLPPYAGGTPEEVMSQVIEERRRELFLEGQRLGDIIRYGLPLYPAPGTPFYVGGEFGTQVCFPLPAVERDNNPNIPG